MTTSSSEDAKGLHEGKNDPFLQMLVGIVNSGAISVGITLNVGGALISGDLVSGRDYFEGFGREWMTFFRERAPEAADAFDQMFSWLAGHYPDPKAPSDVSTDSKPATTDPVHIHLRGARIFQPGSEAIPSNRGVWWRGRLAAVDGFILGSLSTSP